MDAKDGSGKRSEEQWNSTDGKSDPTPIKQIRRYAHITENDLCDDKKKKAGEKPKAHTNHARLETGDVRLTGEDRVPAN